jgi:hypothetical protein
VNHGLKEIFLQFEFIPLPVKWLEAGGLIFWLMQAFEIGMRKALFNSVSLLGTKGQHFREQVKACG